MSLTRRIFMRDGALTVLGTAAMPSFLTRAAFAAGTAPAHKRLVVIFQRGAADGLNIVVPHGERAYYELRPTINIAQDAVLNLDGHFGLHPALGAFKTLWDEKQLAIVHAAGSPDPTRSHFDAQDYMESGTPGRKSTEDGWLNRALPSVPASRSGTFRAVALGPSMPRILSGKERSVAISDINSFGVLPRNNAAQPLADAFEAMYDRSTDSLLHGTGEETFEAVKMLRASLPADYRPAPGANYPRGRFGDALRQTAQLMKASLGVQVAFTDIGGWDHHVNEGSAQGQLANLLREFSESIAAFWTDLGPLAADTVLVTMSEFGRTARENGTRGTDHGHANVMFVLGGSVRGGRVYGRWPGLEPEQLYEQRDLALTTDFRTVLGEAVSRHFGTHDLRAVFPGFDATRDWLHLLG